MKKVLIFTTDLRSGGVKQSTLRMCAALLQEGYSVHVLSYEPLPLNVALEGASVGSLKLALVKEFSGKQRFFGIRRATGLIWALPLFMLVLLRERPDAVFAFSYVPNIIAGLGKILFRKTFLIVSDRQNPILDLNRKGFYFSAIKRVSRCVYRNSDVIHTNLAPFAQEAPAYYQVPPSKVTYFPNFYDFEDIRRRSLLPDREFPMKYVISCGRLSDQKGQWVAIAVFAEIVRRGDYDGHLVILGSGPLRDYLQDRARAAGVAHKVEFIGDLPNPYPALLGADVLVFPSIWEGFANVPMECMGLGVPVVSAPYPGAAEAFGDAALYFDRCYPLCDHTGAGGIIPADELTAMGDQLMSAIRRREELSARVRELSVKYDSASYRPLLRSLIG